jgi:DNA-binding transcriptional MerR regulator
MDEIMISKKELLELTGISYGALYRWKRKNLIPEEWFTRRSTYTGQETFFPKDRILARIAAIKDLKEDASLDDIADYFTPNLGEVRLTKEELVARSIVTKNALDFFTERNNPLDIYTFEPILHMYILDKLLQSGEISLEEAKMLLQTLTENRTKFENKDCDIIFTRKLGVSSCFLATVPDGIYFDAGTRLAARMSVTKSIEELKIKLS